MFRRKQPLLCVLRLHHHQGDTVRHVDKHVLQNKRLFHQENMQKTIRNGKNVLKTAVVTGTLLVGNVIIKLRNQEVVGHEGNEEREEENSGNMKNWPDEKALSLSEAIIQSRDLLQRRKDETGCPGLAIAVSVDGKTVWTEGIGYADVENRLKCTPQSVFRIASISKSITMAAVAKLLENGDLDLDKPVQFYVPEFPEKTWEGQKVQITTRQLLSHLGGIRHYSKDYMKHETETDNDRKQKSVKAQSSVSLDAEQLPAKIDKPMKKESEDEMQLDEYYITRNYLSVLESLEIFKDDPLVHKPGSTFLYTTHGWTLISAVVEKVAKMPFEKYLQKTLDELGLENTYLDEHKPLIYNRGRHYVKNQKGRLENAPYVDLSYKWAGGGLVSNVLDVAKFGNAMLYSYQAKTNSHLSSTSKNSINTDPTTYNESSQKGDNTHLPSYLKPVTMKMMWTPTIEEIADSVYGLGWRMSCRHSQQAFCKDQKFIVYHTGCTVGASSVLFILPNDSTVSGITTELRLKSDQTSTNVQESSSLKSGPPKGVIVAIIANMMSVGLYKTAYDIARIFERIDF